MLTQDYKYILFFIHCILKIGLLYPHQVFCFFFLFFFGELFVWLDFRDDIPFSSEDNFPRHTLSLAPHEADVFYKQLEMIGGTGCAFGCVPPMLFFPNCV